MSTTLTVRSRGKAALGLLVMLLGVLLIIYGIYKGFSFKFETSQIPNIVRQGILYTLVGGVVFIEGVAIQGYKRIPALILHLAAAVPYYLAIQEILKVADKFQTMPQDYFTAAQYYFLAGIILNILGIVANRLKRETTIARTPQN